MRERRYPHGAGYDLLAFSIWALIAALLFVGFVEAVMRWVR